MSNKTNEEKLRILQERLTQIEQKKETASTPRENMEKVIEVIPDEIEDSQKEKIPMSFRWLKYVAIIICGYGAFYAYKNEIKLIDSNSLKSEETNTTKIDKVESPLKYNLDLTGDRIAIAATFEDENSAKAMMNGLKIKGFKADYFYLPNKSNSTEEVYKVFIGPYEHEEETNQWAKNLKVDFEIVTL
jgi:hypothetical protein